MYASITEQYALFILSNGKEHADAGFRNSFAISFYHRLSNIANSEIHFSIP